MSACLSGCTSFGAHKPGCEDEECRGCVPREASEGELCGRCWGNLQRDVRTAPSIVDWIREHVEPSSQWGERINSGEVDAPAPLSVTAVDDADWLFALLAEWARLVLRENPNRLHLKVPGIRISERTERLIVQPAFRAWCDLCKTVQESDSVSTLRETLKAHEEHADVQVRPNLIPWSEVAVVPSRVSGFRPDSEGITAVCKFLTTHAEWIAKQPWAGELVFEVSSVVRTLLARYPQAERSRHLVDARCPACERTTMVYSPPAWAGQDILVQCDHHACGCIVPEKRFGLFMAMVAEDRKRELERSA